MNRITAVLVVAVMLLSPAIAAQEVCPCVPVAHEWVANGCDTWDCAASAVVLAKGDRNIVPMPTNSSDFKWVVLQKIAVGTATSSPKSPFKVLEFDSLPVATAHYYSIDRNLQPILLIAPDGKILVFARTFVERRWRSASN
jgi:hypothetical protein